MTVIARPEPVEGTTGREDYEVSGSVKILKLIFV